jgi:uncharacterized metal-binding protein YceD (DUF177 family)
VTAELPFSHLYNLNRLGLAGDEVKFTAGDAEREALARFAGVLRVGSFTARIELKKLSPNRFRLVFSLDADVVQACVVTLAEVPAHIQLAFDRELHFQPALRRTAEDGAVEVPLEDDAPEEIDSLHYDLAAALIEEFILALDPYPRAPGVEFQAPEGEGAAESPFAVLKGLKSGP